MLNRLKKRVWEAVRCTRHNWLHLHQFKLSYDGRLWHLTDQSGLHLQFPFYPYNNAHEAEGYLRLGRWQLEEGMVVVDGGACYGDFSLYASRRVGKTGRVLMVEPDPANIAEAKQLFALNGGLPQNVEIVPAGLWRSHEILRFAAGRGQLTYVLSADEAPPPGATISEIPVESLSSLVERYGLKRLDFVKLDIEGSELEMMETAQEVMTRFSPWFSIASYHLRDNQMTAVKLQQMFHDMGYQSEFGFPAHPTTWAARQL